MRQSAPALRPTLGHPRRHAAFPHQPSHANKVRPAALAEQRFWKTLEHLQSISPALGSGRAGKRLAHRFKTTIHVVDPTAIQLVAACLDWARHRRRTAAAKCHLRLDLHSFLPRLALIDTARDNDAKRAREVCAGIRAGEIVLFDKAYVDFDHLRDLNARGVFWVTRAQDNLQFKVVKRRLKKPAGKILLTGPQSRADYPPRRTGPESVDEAASVAGSVDALLLDSGNQKLAIKELGGTGRTHDWRISRQIVESVRVPVFLAGGLTPENVATAIREVRPFGLDVCSGLRTKGNLDEEKVRRFFANIVSCAD